MTKTELLAWIENQTWVQSVGEPVTVDAASGWQKVTIREVDGDVAVNRIIHFYETPDGCYWKDSEPAKTLGSVENAAPAYKMITFRTIMDAIGAEMYMSLRTKLDIAAAENVLIRDVVRWLETVGPDAGIDINSENTQTQIQGMVSLGVITQSEADAVIDLAD